MEKNNIYIPYSDAYTILYTGGGGVVLLPTPLLGFLGKSGLVGLILAPHLLLLLLTTVALTIIAIFNIQVIGKSFRNPHMQVRGGLH